MTGPALPFPQPQPSEAMEEGVCNASFRASCSFQLRLRTECCHTLHLPASPLEVAAWRHTRYEGWQWVGKMHNVILNKNRR